MKQILLLTLAFGLCGCASTNADRSGPRRSATFISGEEVRASTAANALELVQTARPGWLRKRGAVSFRMDGHVLVYLDDSRLGGIDALHSLPLSGIESLRYLDPVAAGARFGLSHPHGAIQIQSRTRSPPD